MLVITSLKDKHLPKSDYNPEVEDWIPIGGSGKKTMYLNPLRAMDYVEHACPCGAVNEVKMVEEIWGAFGLPNKYYVICPECRRCSCTHLDIWGAARDWDRKIEAELAAEAKKKETPALNIVINSADSITIKQADGKEWTWTCKE